MVETGRGGEERGCGGQICLCDLWLAGKHEKWKVVKSDGHIIIQCIQTPHTVFTSENNYSAVHDTTMYVLCQCVPPRDGI